eukprot:TRINITY_DN478_c0_g1_i1.p1 TRINITY_DN478_c0_g1~~TRINITY_DN478_c0_g1_i1.p1  ORF type:complete len:399 (-),score=126.07 TRINITY_DN478_c0_g1_i1:224-1420(-)
MEESIANYIQQTLIPLLDIENMSILDVKISLLKDCKYSSDGKHIALGTGELPILLCDDSIIKVPVPSDIETTSIYSVDFSSNGLFMAVCTFRYSIIIYKMEDFSIFATYEHYSLVLSLAFSNCSKYLFFADYLGQIIKLNIEEMRVCKKTTVHTDWINQIAISSNDEYILSGCKNGTVRIVDSIELSCFQEFVYPSFVFAVCFQPFGNLIAVGGFANVVQLYDIFDGRLVDTFKFNGAIYALQFFSHDILILMAGDGYIFCVDISTGQQIQKVFCNCNSEVFSFAISPDKKSLVCGKCDNQHVKRYPILFTVSQLDKIKLVEMTKSGVFVLANGISVGWSQSTIREMVAEGISMSPYEYELISDLCWDLVDVNEINGGNMYMFAQKVFDKSDLSDSDT